MKILLLLFFISTTANSSISFQEALTQIIERSGTTLKAKNETKAAKISQLSSKLSFLPTISAYTYKSKYENKTTDYEGIEIKGNLNLWNSGQDYYNYQSSSSLLAAAKANEASSYLDDEQTASTTLIKYISINKLIEIHKRNVDLKANSLNVIKRRYSKGITPQNEVLKSEVNLANAEANLADSIISLNNIKLELINLLGSSDVSIEWPWKEKLKNLSISNIKNKSLKFSAIPTLNVTQNSLLALTQQTKEKRAQLLPKIDFSISRELTKAYSQSIWETVSTISLTIPIFSGLKDYSRHYDSKIALINLQRDATIIKREIKRDFDSAKYELIGRIKMVNKREQNVRSSRRVYLGNFKRFKKGLTSTNELEIDQGRLLNSEKLFISGIEQLHLSYVKFCHSLGKNTQSCNI